MPRNIYVVSSKGGTRRLVVPDGTAATWAPNSRRVAYAAWSDGAIRTVALDGSSTTLVGPPGSVPPEGVSNGVDWSPNGSLIAYSDGFRLLVIRVNKKGEPLGSPQLLVDDTATWNGSPSFTKSSKQIVFHSGRGPGLYVVDVSDGMVSEVAGIPQVEKYDPAASPDTNAIAYAGR